MPSPRRPATPIPINPKYQPREYSRLRSMKDKGSPQTQWKHQAEYAAQINASTEFVKVMWDMLSGNTTPKSDGFDMFPFKLYSPISWFYPKGQYTGSTGWRTFRVHGGAVLTSYVDSRSMVLGTDGAVWPDDHSYPLPVTSHSVVIPLGVPQYWFWIHSRSGSFEPYQLYWGSNPKTDATASGGTFQAWDNFPSASSYNIPIGYVDTLSSASIQRALIRQYQRTDVVATGGAGGNYVPMRVCVNNEVQTWMVDAYQSSSATGSSP